MLLLTGCCFTFPSLCSSPGLIIVLKFTILIFLKCFLLPHNMVSKVQAVKESVCNAGRPGSILNKRSLEKGMLTHSSILDRGAWWGYTWDHKESTYEWLTCIHTHHIYVFHSAYIFSMLGLLLFLRVAFKKYDIGT